MCQNKKQFLEWRIASNLSKHHNLRKKSGEPRWRLFRSCHGSMKCLSTICANQAKITINFSDQLTKQLKTIEMKPHHYCLISFKNQSFKV